MKRDPDADSEAVVASSRDGQCFAEVFERRAPEIWRFLASRLGKEAADELLSEVFTRAFAARGTFDPTRASARTWLYGIATNVCREQSRRMPPGAFEQADRELSVADESERVAERASITEAFRRLPAEWQEVVLLVGAVGLSYRDTASVLAVPVGTVRSRFFRARRKLRRLLTEQELERRPTYGRQVIA